MTHRFRVGAEQTEKLYPTLQAAGPLQLESLVKIHRTLADALPIA